MMQQRKLSAAALCLTLLRFRPCRGIDIATFEPTQETENLEAERRREIGPERGVPKLKMR